MARLGFHRNWRPSMSLASTSFLAFGLNKPPSREESFIPTKSEERVVALCFSTSCRYVFLLDVTVLYSLSGVVLL